MRNPSFNLAKITNDTTRKGELAARKQLFGDASRYAIAPVHTRFDRVSWFVWDAERFDASGRPEVIRQEDTFEAAMRALDA